MNKKKNKVKFGDNLITVNDSAFFWRESTKAVKYLENKMVHI